MSLYQRFSATPIREPHLRKRKQKPKDASRLIVVLAFDGMQLLDVTGPVQTFASANEMVCGAPAHGAPYRIVVVSRRGGAIRSSSGLPVLTQPIAKAVGKRRI